MENEPNPSFASINGFLLLFWRGIGQRLQSTMRMIGHLKSEASARTFGGYLSSLEIRNMVEPDSEGWAVWIYSEDQIEKGYQALTDYIKNPADRNFQQGADSAAAAEIREQKEHAAFAKRVRTADQIFQGSNTAPVTLFLIGACVCVVAVCGVNMNPVNVKWLLISEGWPGFLPEVRHGEVWRLISADFPSIFGLTRTSSSICWCFGTSDA